MNKIEVEESVIEQSVMSASSHARKLGELNNTSYHIFSASFFEVTFADGVFIFELSKNVKVTRAMAMEYMDSLEFIYVKMKRPIPSLCKVSGIAMLDSGAREYLGAHQNRGFLRATAIVASNVVLKAFLKVISNFIAKNSFPVEFFDTEKQSRDWLENRRQEFGHEFISDEEVKAAFSL